VIGGATPALSQASSHPELSTLAGRIFETPTNSVASERAFSCMGLIGNKLRNRLSPEKVSKLSFIYMNQRALDSLERDVVGLSNWIDQPNQEQVDLEEAVLFTENESGSEISEDNMEVE
jgi:hypothetical protein